MPAPAPAPLAQNRSSSGAQQAPPSHQTHPNGAMQPTVSYRSKALEIFGPHSNTPVVVSLLANGRSGWGETEMRTLRLVLDRHPQARVDMGVAYREFSRLQNEPAEITSAAARRFVFNQSGAQ